MTNIWNFFFSLLLSWGPLPCLTNFLFIYKMTYHQIMLQMNSTHRGFLSPIVVINIQATGCVLGTGPLLVYLPSTFMYWFQQKTRILLTSLWQRVLCAPCRGWLGEFLPWVQLLKCSQGRSSPKEGSTWLEFMGNFGTLFMNKIILIFLARLNPFIKRSLWKWHIKCVRYLPYWNLVLWVMDKYFS